jgi:serine O-acetyltransferase
VRTTRLRQQESFFATVRADIEAFAELKRGRLDTPAGVADAVMFPGVMAVLLFRLASVCHRRRLKLLSRLIYILNVILFGADLAPKARLGPGLTLPHPVGVIIGADVVAGRKLRVFQQVTLGAGAQEDPALDGMPTLGDGCWVFGSAKLLGPILVGDAVLVSVNSVVMKSVPSGAVVAGNPAIIRRYREGFTAPPDMDSGRWLPTDVPAPARPERAAP